MGDKQTLNLNFAQGLDTKTDPKQVSPGKFLSLENSIFDTGGQLKKRNGYGQLPNLPDTSSSYSTTFNGNLTAIGSSIKAFNPDANTWVSKGAYVPLSLSTLPLIRNSFNQIQCDAAIAANGLVCTVYSETNATTTVYKYAIANSVTGQNIFPPTLIPVSSGVVTGSPRVFVLANYFVIVFTNVISATSHLQYISISTYTPSTVTANADIASAYVSSPALTWDGVVINNNLYIAYNTVTGGQSVKFTYIASSVASAGGPPQTATTFAGSKATVLAVCADFQQNNVYASFYDSVSGTGYTIAVDLNLNIVIAATAVQIVFTGGPVLLAIACAAQNGICTNFLEATNNYSYDSAIPTHYIQTTVVKLGTGVTSSVVSIRSVGLASKAFILNGVVYYLAAYQSPFQPTYFLVNGSTSTATNPIVIAKLAYENGGGYLTLGLPSVSIVGTNTAYVPYLFKDLVQALTTVQNTTQTTVGGIYSQTGVNFCAFEFTTNAIDSVETGNNLNLSGGFGWMYDGYLPVEQGFFLWPDSIECVYSTTGGTMAAQPDGTTNTNAYFYQATYEWADNQGNIFRSAPSIPVAVTTTGTASTSSVTINVPNLRLTYKTQNPLKIVIYRWSVANQVYHQVTSITVPTVNSTTSDSTAYVDKLPDASIIGNNLIYTTGGVVEDVNPPASNIMTLFDTRAWLVDAEDPNLLWFSKQVIEATPVEWSDLFTFYVAPTTAAQGSTGPITALAPMDDKLIIFKNNALYYINGIGPDNTGANNGYSQPIFITSTVGCTNQQSIVFMPQGLMFQSDKGIWLLGRDMSTQYIGAAVERFNNSLVQSAVNVPATNQARFTLNTGQTLMYDYFYGQWGTFVGVPAISSCIYQDLHTFINSFGQVYQETPGLYLDGSNPVEMSFETSWINAAGLQGYQRFYYFYFLGEYLSPHLVNVDVAFNYVDSPLQNSVASPQNFSASFPSPFGDYPAPFGSSASLEQWQVHAKIQKCTSFKITLQEIYDPTFGVPAGAGLSLSGLAIIVGIKKGVRPIRAANTVG